MLTTCPLPRLIRAGRKAFKTQKWAKVLAPKVLHDQWPSPMRLPRKDLLCDVVLRQVEQ